MLRGVAGPSSPVRFVALDPNVSAGFATNVNGVVVPLGAGLTFQQYRQPLIAGVRAAVGSGRIEQAVVSGGGARTLRLWLTLGRTITVQTLQYGFPRSRRSVVVTSTTLPRFAPSYGATFRRSAASIRFSS